jgi:hypothetical protein
MARINTPGLIVSFSPLARSARLYLKIVYTYAKSVEAAAITSKENPNPVAQVLAVISSQPGERVAVGRSVPCERRFKCESFGGDRKSCLHSVDGVRGRGGAVYSTFANEVVHRATYSVRWFGRSGC